MAPNPPTATGANEMGTLTGKTAVVTGSTSGIGLAYARAFAGAGANIVLNGMGAPEDIEKERSGIEAEFTFKAAYVSAKHGIAGLTKTVALELATFKITCNCISPGYVWTPLVEKQIPDTMKARNLTKEQVIHDVLLEAQPTKEFVTSEQVAALALFLCGDDAAQITGANLSIDGGWTAA